MKWVEGAKQGIVVAGGEGQGNGLTQLHYPNGVVVDQLGTVYVADRWNHRIMRWVKGATQGSVIVGRNGRGEQPNQLNWPIGLSFDRHGNLYIVDRGNHRVQKFNVDSNA
jgi:sugar lactone lactonase YvrE